MPAMSAPQQEAWHALMDLQELVPSNWCLVGGQMVHLHCAERGGSPIRPTDDADTVVDVRTQPDILRTFTAALTRLGFRADTAGNGMQHRWKRDQAQIDVLIPEGVGERAGSRGGIQGAPQSRRREPPKRWLVAHRSRWTSRDGLAPCAAPTWSGPSWGRLPRGSTSAVVAQAGGTAQTSSSSQVSSLPATSATRF